MRRYLRWFSRFRRLQWKLTFSYTFTTVCALLFVEIVLLSVAYTLVVFNLPQLLLNGVQQKAEAMRPYVIGASIDGNMAQMLLLNKAAPGTKTITIHATSNDVTLTYEGFIVVVDGNGKIIASQKNGAPAPISGTMLQSQLPTQAAQSLHKLLTSRQPQPASLISYQGVFYLMAPVMGSDSVVRGAVFMEANHVQPPWNTLLMGFINVILVSFILYLICAGMVGTIFGFMTARGFTSRFTRLSLAVDHWSKGNFSTFVQDSSGDELGQLARQLNRMAEQLQNLLQTRQKLATLEERNRLARDLHDSVKQEVFAVSMQVSTAKALLGRDVDAARERLNEAERLVRQSQQELTSLIRELRPVALEGKGLVLALQELVNDWQHQTTITATFGNKGEAAIPLIAEEGLFRVTQEALSNVARHSHATTAQLLLTCEYDAVTLSIVDDGCGFDVHTIDGRGIGLLSMKERVQALGGDIEVTSARDRGTTVVVHYKQPGAVAREHL